MKVPISIREVDLRKKPKELIAISPKATVPVLQTKDGLVIDESIEIIKWAIKVNKNKPLIKVSKQDDIVKIYKLIEQNDNEFKFHLDRYKYSYRYNKGDIEKAFHRKKAREILFEWNNNIKKNKLFKGKEWIALEHESLADWSIWPFVRQYCIADPLIFNEENDLIFLRNWLHYYLKHYNFKYVMKKRKVWTDNDKNLED